jgi:hypothetical protein
MTDSEASPKEAPMDTNTALAPQDRGLRPLGSSPVAYPNRGRPPGAVGAAKTAANPIDQWKPWYDDMIAFLLANPGADARDVAKHVKKHPVYVAALLRSDFMRGRIAAAQAFRREGLTTALVNAATSGVNKLKERIDREQGEISTTNLIDATETLLGALGLSGKGAGQPVPMQQTVAITVSGSVLAKAREEMKTVEHAPLGEAKATPALDRAMSADGLEE